MHDYQSIQAGIGARGESAVAAVQPAEHSPDGDYSLWPDAWLVTAVRCDEPDQAALNALAVRFESLLWRRCLWLTGNRDKAGDLAQEAWFRMLRNRRSLRPEKSFRAYLVTVATNLWRDKHRAARRAGAMAEHRLVIFDSVSPSEGGGTVATKVAAVQSGAVVSAEAVPDLQEEEAQTRRLLVEEVHHTLACLNPLHREVLQARFLKGESCAEIGRRYGRTEQTVSGWVRDAVSRARCHLESLDLGFPGN